jgi:hypothetical protein
VNTGDDDDHRPWLRPVHPTDDPIPYGIRRVRRGATHVEGVPLR